jgi:hypothetical protein
VELTPAQQDVLDQLRRGRDDRPEVPAELRHELRGDLERALGSLAGRLDRPVFVGKAVLSRILACEAHHVSEEGEEFSWSLAAARGTVAHKAIQLSVNRHHEPPLQLVEDALDRLIDDPNERIADFLLQLTDAERAELRSEANELVAGFLELWPPLHPRWQPQTESRRRAELCGSMVILSGKVDLTLGAPQGLTAGRVVVDLKTGAPHGGHAEDLRFYALLDTLRVGVPPFRLASWYLDSGRLAAEDVTPELLEATVRRVVAAATKAIELRLGLRSPSTNANPACRWCRLREDCDTAAAWGAELTAG